MPQGLPWGGFTSLKKMVKKKRSSKKRSGSINRNLVIGVIVIVVLALVALNFGSYDSEDGLGTINPFKGYDGYDSVAQEYFTGLFAYYSFDGSNPLADNLQNADLILLSGNDGWSLSEGVRFGPYEDNSIALRGHRNNYKKLSDNAITISFIGNAYDEVLRPVIKKKASGRDRRGQEGFEIRLSNAEISVLAGGLGGEGWITCNHESFDTYDLSYVGKYFAVVVDANNVKIYVNGELCDEGKKGNFGLKANKNHLFIGSNGFEGSVDSVKIWTRDLSQNEILYDASYPGSCLGKYSRKITSGRGDMISEPNEEIIHEEVTLVDGNAYSGGKYALPVTDSEWIIHPTQSALKDAYFWVEKDFGIDSSVFEFSPVTAKLEIAADDSYEVYLNGVLAAKGVGHQQTQTHDISEYIDTITGENNLKIRYINNRHGSALTYKLLVESDLGACSAIHDSGAVCNENKCEVLEGKGSVFIGPEGYIFAVNRATDNTFGLDIVPDLKINESFQYASTVIALESIDNRYATLTGAYEATFIFDPVADRGTECNGNICTVYDGDYLVIEGEPDLYSSYSYDYIKYGSIIEDYEYDGQPRVYRQYNVGDVRDIGDHKLKIVSINENAQDSRMNNIVFELV